MWKPATAVTVATISMIGLGTAAHAQGFFGFLFGEQRRVARPPVVEVYPAPPPGPYGPPVPPDERYYDDEPGPGARQSYRGERRGRAAKVVPSERLACRRLCDDARIVIRIQEVGRPTDDAERMCAAAGEATGTQTRFEMEDLQPAQMAAAPAAKPVQEGRAATTTEPGESAETVPDKADKKPGALAAPGGRLEQAKKNACPVDVPLLRVPIEADETLERGDIVMTVQGPKVFVGDHDTPHRPAEFTAAKLSKEDRKRLAAGAGR